MKEMKVSALVALAVMLLALVIAITFNFATISYQREVATLRKNNAELANTIQGYKATLEGIKNQLVRAGFRVQ
ncbi:MAG: hypothetical protein V1863_04215 [Candidatus Omnitrophota bacterium]